jgi:hypothetical protein
MGDLALENAVHVACLAKQSQLTFPPTILMNHLP